MVMKGRHFKQSLFRQLVENNLKNYGEPLNSVYASKKEDNRWIAKGEGQSAG